MTNVRLLGLDGMSPEILEELVHEELLPQGSELLRLAPARPLRSTVPFYTIPGWASVFTGTLPGRHGLLWWRRSDPVLPWRTSDLRGFSRLDDAYVPTLWRLVSASGGRVCVVDVPATFPAPEVNGLFISGWLAPWPDPRAVWPADRAEEFASWLEPAPVPGAEQQNIDTEHLVRALTESATQRLPVFRDACRDPGVELVAAVLVGPDRLSHLAWPSMIPSKGNRNSGLGAAVTAYWRVVDEFLGEVLEAHGRGEAFIICSDHGSAPSPGLRFHTRTWLAREGFIEATSAGRFMRPRVAKALRPLRRIAEPVRQRRSRRDGVSFGLASGPVADLAPGDHEAAFFIDPGASDATDMRDRLAAGLATVEHDGAPVFESVMTGAEAIGDPDARMIAPDLIAVSRPGIGVTPGSVLDSIVSPDHATRGTHQRDGVFVLGTDHLETPDEIAGVEDITPTALSLLGFEPPAWMTGRSLVLRPTGRAVSPVPDSPAPGVSVEEQEEIERSLRALGYID